MVFMECINQREIERRLREQEIYNKDHVGTGKINKIEAEAKKVGETQKAAR